MTALATGLQPVRSRRALRPDGGVRTEIQALRALAVMAVLLFHLWPNRLPGGFVGVDVFFVISGYLITTHLLAEVSATGRLQIGRFWAKRAKRILPISLLVLLLSTLAVVVWVPASLWRQFLTEVIASALYGENWLLAANSVDYLAAANVPSLVQNYWTLSVEEQFYIGLPLLILAALFIARALGASARRAVFSAILGVAVLSFITSIWLTQSSPSTAYFATQARAWEFAAGALLAFVTLLPRPALRLVGPWLGVAAILLASVAFDETTPFPGFAALVPVLGTVLVILTGRKSGLSLLGLWSPIAFLGRVSYAIYLWHWPLLVLIPYITGRPLGLLDKLLVIALTILIAWASTTFIEDPIRFSPRLLGRGRRPRTVALWTGASMVVVVGCALWPLTSQAAEQDERRAAAAEVVNEAPDCLGAQAMDPEFAPCVNASLEGILVPDPTNLEADDSNEAACWAGMAVSTLQVCQFGADSGYDKHVIMVGDSHNNTLIAAYKQMAEDLNWKIEVAGHAGCYWTTADQVKPSEALITACRTWKTELTSYLKDSGPYDAIIVTNSAGSPLLVPVAGETVEQTTVRGLVEAWGSLADNSTPIVAIRDNPRMGRDIPDCVEEHRLEAATLCVTPRAEALASFDGQAEAARRFPNATAIDLTDFYCSRTVCPSVIGHTVVYRDGSHLTATFVKSLTPYLSTRIVAAVEELSGSAR